LTTKEKDKRENGAVVGTTASGVVGELPPEVCVEFRECASGESVASSTVCKENDSESGLGAHESGDYGPGDADD